MDGAATWNEDHDEYDDGEHLPEVDYANRYAEAETAARELCHELARAGVTADARTLRVRPHMTKTGRPWVKLSARSAQLLTAYLASHDACPK
ncbi:hypothetical protein [Streptantibioticus ferralitis]|uniref:Uncharacterized protein n=1 Tax=Streptantibioticus ferralitis TaxID=236510 RepID=A0ABT5YUR8_9ACTN|nr:hypothetical protein [Streptantibioticus ferralitis]MDF2255356.1 hypothetical protein [Streptantibioticus ferralitis]